MRNEREKDEKTFSKNGIRGGCPPDLFEAAMIPRDHLVFSRANDRS